MRWTVNEQPEVTSLGIMEDVGYAGYRLHATNSAALKKFAAPRTI